VMHDPRSGDLLAALNHGHFGIKLHRSRDGGETWPEIAVPAYPPMPEGYVPKPHPFTGKAIDWALKLIWGLAPGGPDEPGVVWCGTMPGGFVQVERQWRLVGTQSPAVGSPEARRLGPERRRASGHSFNMRRPARFPPREYRRLDRWCMDHARRRKVLGPDGRRNARGLFSP
jgi:hypothetical protein